jgi:hypothetical protein
MYGLVSDPSFVFLILLCAAVITIGAAFTALNRIPRTGFVQLHNEFEKLAERVKALEAAEQRRFVRELNSRSEGAEAKYTTNGSGRLEAESPVQ